jgi:hypothetical protein
MRRTKRKRNKNATQYCEYSSNCDKDINCKAGEYCAVFIHTKSFSSLRTAACKEAERKT